jgi:hypothetical protein
MTKRTGKKIKLKRGDTQTRVGSNLTAIVWQGKRNVNTLTNMLFQPAEVGFYSELGKSLKPVIIISCGSKLSNKLFRLTFARDLIQDMKVGGESNTGHKASKTSPIHQPTNRLDTRQRTLAPGRELN